MNAITVGDIILFLGVIGLAGIAVFVTVVTKGIGYKKSRRIPPYKK